VSKKGKLFVISAPSGSGKTTLCDKLINSLAAEEKLVHSVSATTRKPRRGEREGSDYFFISKSEFLKRRQRKEFLEWAQVLGNYYGTPRAFIQEKTLEGRDVLLNIDVQGALKIKRMIKNAHNTFSAVFIFILPPSFQELKRRLLMRSTESKKEIERRLLLAKKEMSDRFVNQYDYVVINDAIEKSLQQLMEIVEHERGR
jgi:guanylate kinase